VRSRIVGLAIWASALAIGLFGVPLGVAVLQYALQAERSELQGVADAVAIVVAGDVYDDEQIDYVSRQGAIELAVYDDNGTLLGGRGPTGAGPELADALAGRVGTGTRDDRLVVAVPVTHDGDMIGAVEATAPHAVMQRKVAAVWAAMAALAALAIGATWLVARRQARRLSRPLEDLAVGAGRLGDGDFSVRVRRGGVPEIDAVGCALNDTAGRLDDLLARERAFSADASHQLRTPLAGLRLRLEAALEQPDGDLRSAIGASLVDADRLQATIEELLTLARERNERVEPLDLVALLAELSPEWAGRLALHGRDLDLRVAPEASTRPCASAAAVRQVLAVLVDNATTHGGGTVTITIRDAGEAVAIDVSDEGPGVQVSEGALFSRRVETADTHGIGLPLARRLAEAEHGRLGLTSSSPPVFTLLLPPAGLSTTSRTGDHLPSPEAPVLPEPVAPWSIGYAGPTGRGTGEMS
jgi:signal transduction histidine kinase